MKHNYIVRLTLVLFVLAIFSSPLLAQKYEIHPYAGGFFPDQFAFGSKLKADGIYGVKGGVFLTRNVELEGNFGYVNHFKLGGPDPESRAIIWEALGSYNFKNFPGSFNRLQPYAGIGLGGVSAYLGSSETGLLNAGSSNPLVLEDGDTFFTFSYGGGVKSNRWWGPLGFRADVRGRTLPNFFGRSTSWLELTGGINITWGGGERSN